MSGRQSLHERLASLSPEQRRQLRERIANGPVRLTPTQFGIWLFEQLNPGTTAYHNPAGLRIRGTLDADLVRRSLELLHQRHEALRIRIDEDDEGMPVQSVTAPAAVALELTDLSALPAAVREDRALAVAVSSAREPFDLAAGPVWRARLIRLAEDDHVLVVTFHHIVSDGWSLTVVLREFALAYQALATGRTPELPPLPRRYRDVIAGVGRVTDDERHRLLEWWRDRLAGAPPAVRLPADLPAAPGYAGAALPFHLDEEVTAGLRGVCRSAGASLFAGVAAAFCVALHELTGERDLVLTTPVAGREDPATQHLVGCLLNTVPVRVRIAPDRSLRALLAETSRAVAAAVEHSAVPFSEIVAVLGRADGEDAVSNVMVLHGNAGVSDLRVGDLHLSRYWIPVIASKHDLALLVTPGQRDVRGELEYRSALFSPTAADRIRTAVTSAARRLATDPDTRPG